ncbi:hypothetical protein LTS16_012523 [Friedmanniomyces endolithicus]|nr:hypothetical protein LTR57_023787 [Friedmanniomyces endolithicus]KAK0989910.1 hypothetical protein LTS01_008700 [Friedmanniomyces endolithicus]KAK1037905.1 hypothetical protein LTS16_012523 [Friedmanniomyces endolithicus]
MAAEHRFETPPAKRRQLLAIRPTPPHLSDLMTAFGAQKTPESRSKMQRLLAGHDMRTKTAVNYAESESSPDSSPQSASSFEDPVSSRTSIPPESRVNSDEESSEDELHSQDVIQVPQRQSGTRVLPARSTRSRVSYASPKKKPKKKSSKKAKSKSKSHANQLLTSDTVKIATARGALRQGYIDHTKPKRDTFLIVNKKYFLPLLPDRNYIAKLAGLQAQGTERSMVEYTAIHEQPSGITATLKPYQLTGLSFLVHMYKNGMSPILGDEMGLGKTLQTLALFQWLKENEPDASGGEIRPHLVICPLSVLSSWLNETRKWTPGLKVVRFHGPVAERDRLKKELAQAHDPKTFDVLVTTYETFKAEATWMKRAFVWRYAVLDEGHKIKNDKSDIALALQSLKAEHRLLLTGTPLQNNLKEFWALLHWLIPEVFADDTALSFRQAFNLTEGKVSTTFMDDSRRLLELLMLRRMKSSPEVNLGLPEKTEVLLYVPLTPMQRFWYMRLITRADNATIDELFQGAKDKELQTIKQEGGGLVMHDDAAHDTVWSESREVMQAAVEKEQQDEAGGKNKWRKLFNLITQLRKVCIHPYILQSAMPDPYYLGEHIKSASGKFIVLEKLVEKLVLQDKKKILIFAGWTKTLDLCEDLLALKGGNGGSFRYLRLDGGKGRAERNLGIRLFNDRGNDYQVMLISTRAGGLGLNLATATEVIFMDEDWNPQITLQAEARAHRIGQQNPVTVYKICTQGSVEEQMMGRIRKKLYLSTKITESMRSIHSTQEPRGKKRRLNEDASDEADGDEPALSTDSLKSLIRQGARALTRPQVDVTAMLGWDFDTMIEECKDKTDDVFIQKQTGNEDEEQAWLNTMEKVETTVFEGKKHQRELMKAEATNLDLSRADRRIGKNTTVMIDGFAINKESLACADWEAVPTMAGKDPRLAEPVRAKKEAVPSQSFCQHCWDGGNLVLCSGCPRAYHTKCLDPEFQSKALGIMNFFCSQHQCVDCGAKTTEAGGMIFRCRWCEKGYCEDCLDWEKTNLIGDNLPEYKMLGCGARAQAWYIECPGCTERWETDEVDRLAMVGEKKRIERGYEVFVEQQG